MEGYKELHERLLEVGQEHLLRFWNELNDDERELLIKDIKELDLDKVEQYFKDTVSSLNANTLQLDERLQPIPDEKIMRIHQTQPSTLSTYHSIGMKHISLGHAAVLLMAGGQGTRLGSKDPKGMFNVGLLSGKTLFQLQVERIRKLQDLAYETTGNKGIITWYIMTSEHTKQPTYKYLKANKFFGLDETNVILFEQGSLPCYDYDGKILLDEKHRIARAPDGNGGLYRALYKHNILTDMSNRGIRYVHVHSVDNILIKVADPVFIGYCAQQNADCGSKVVQKDLPDEAVGLVALVNGKYQVVEYSEISSKTREMRNADGTLTYNNGNICNHLFSRQFLERICNSNECKLKLHIAKKKIPFVDNSGKRIIPNQANGIKIEKFVFDVFEFAKEFVAVQVLRSSEFSALKNSDSVGSDCPSTARKHLYRLHKQYIEDAGGIVEGDECEISPLVSYDGEHLESLVKNQVFKAPFYLKAKSEM